MVLPDSLYKTHPLCIVVSQLTYGKEIHRRMKSGTLIQTNRSSEKISRSEHWTMRIIYFLGIIFIVVGHAGTAGLPFMDQWFPFYSFHIQLFQFAAGYLFVSEGSRSFPFFLANKIKKLMIPFFIWNLVYGCLVTCLHRVGYRFGERVTFRSLFLKPLWHGHQFWLNSPTWYVTPHLLVQILSYFPLKLLVTCSLTAHILYWLGTIVLACLGTELAMHGLGSPSTPFLIIPRVTSFLHIYTAGYIYRQFLEQLEMRIRNIVFFTIHSSLILLWTLFCGPLRGYVLSWCNNFDNFWKPVITPYFGITFWVRVARILTPILRDSPIVICIAKNTFSIMTHHLTGFFCLNTAFNSLHRIGVFPTFDSTEYYKNVYYIYKVRNNDIMLSLYHLAGISVSLLIKRVEQIVTHQLNKCYHLLRADDFSAH